MLCILLQLLSHVFDNHAMDLLFWYIDLRQNSDVRLAFEALKVTVPLFAAFVFDGGFTL